MSADTLPIFGARPRARAYLGDTSDLGASDAYNAWAASVKARGGVVTVMPDHIATAIADKLVGTPAGRFPLPKGKTSRYVTANGQWYYEPAGTLVQLQDKVAAVQRSLTIAAGKAAGVGEQVGKAVLDAPRAALSEVTGIPSWLIPALLLAGGAFLVAKELGADKAIRRHFAKNPRGRRRRRPARGARKARRHALARRRR